MCSRFFLRCYTLQHPSASPLSPPPLPAVMPSIAVDPANKVQSVMPPAQYIVRESEGDDVVHADDMFKDTNPWDLLPPGWRRTYREQTNRQPGLNSPFENLANYICFF